LIKPISEQNVDKNIKVNSNYRIPVSYAKFQRTTFLKPLNQDTFIKQTINFKGSIDKNPNVTNPIQIANPKIREELKKNIIQSLEQKTFIEGSLIDFYKKGVLTNQDILEIATLQAGRIPLQDRTFFIENKIPLTLADNEDVLNKRLYDFETPQLDIDNPSYIQQKPKIIQIGEKSMENIPKNKKMIIILTGLPASGKSSLVDKKMQKKYYLADADEYLKYFSEYENGKGSNVLQNVARDLLRNNLFPMALDKGVNIVLSTIGWLDYVEEIVKDAKDKGYTIELRHVNIAPEKSIQRTVSRFKETKRLVDPYWINGYSNRLYDEFSIRLEDLPEYLKDSPNIDKISLYDNNKDYAEKKSAINKILKHFGIQNDKKKPEYIKTIKNEIKPKKIKLTLEKFKIMLYNNIKF